MTLFRKVMWGTTIFTYVVFAITIIGDVFYVPDFNPSHDPIYTLLSLCCIYTLFSFIIGGFNIIGWIVMFIYDRLHQVDFEIKDIFLLLMNIAIIPVFFWFLWQALMGV